MTLIVGIDPDMKKSGVCSLDSTGRIMTLDSLTIVDLMAFIEWNKDAVYAIEDVTKNKAIYGRGMKDYARTAKAQSVGMVKASATLIGEVITEMTGRAPILAPCGLGKQVKHNADMFKALTGYEKQTNEDKRDAWAIAYWVFKNKERLV